LDSDEDRYLVDLVCFVCLVFVVNETNQTNQTNQIDQNMALPGHQLHPLKGNLAGLWSVSVSGNWRIVFRFEDGTAHDVELIDYH